MPGFEYDLGYIQAGLQEIKEFILSNDVYWSTGASSPPGEPDFPQLTLGGLLLSRARLHALPLEIEQSTRLAVVDAELDRVRTHWRAVWGHKAEREFHARLNLWRDFLEEARTNPEDHTDRYHYEVGRRVMLELLRDEAQAIPAAEQDLLDALDKLLRSMFETAPFVWDSVYRRAFPEGKFWYLYGHLKGPGY